ncbi:hypothetical protein AB6A40_007840 [Gnathostoma spinigerum]|uniref:Uncharacterized protein n=1 Tax=Gnathostoma spinigerum TaxID=75299 RepID=A0ABD6EUL0_9BILA
MMQSLTPILALCLLFAITYAQNDETMESFCREHAELDICRLRDALADTLPDASAIVPDHVVGRQMMKRKSAFVRFGKRDLMVTDDDDDNDDDNHELLKRKSAFVRFGRSGEDVKRKSSYIRFG